jgi:hypothetical protein
MLARLVHGANWRHHLDTREQKRQIRDRNKAIKQLAEATGNTAAHA